MARRAPFGSFHEDPPAIVRESMPLFEYVMEQTKAAKEVAARLDAAREDHARTVTILHESMEWRKLEAAKERIKDARKAALENDDDLANAREEAKAAAKALKKTAAALVKAEKKARGEVKLLAAVKGETERRVLGALAAGKVPQTVPDDAVERAVGKASESLAALAGTEVTAFVDGKPVTIQGKGKRAP